MFSDDMPVVVDSGISEGVAVLIQDGEVKAILKNIGQ